MSPEQYIMKLESYSSRTAKEKLFAEAVKNPEFAEGVALALNPFMTYGIKKVPTKTDPKGKGLPFHEFSQVLSLLHTRDLTGNAAKFAVEEMMERATQDQWNYWYRLILIKDLRCGVQITTANKFLNIPTFDCQLATDSLKHPKKVKGKKYCQVKLDGVRVLTFVYPNGNVIQYSRNGKELDNFKDIVDQFQQIAYTLSEPTVFDGEVMSKNFQDLMTQVNRKKDVDTSDAMLYLFDMIPMAAFEAGRYDETQTARETALSQFYEANKNTFENIRILHSKMIDLDTEFGQAEFTQFNKDAIKAGHEGIMIKDASAPYECKRTFHWLKLKPYIDVTMKVTGFKEGIGKYEGALGAFIAEGTEDGVFFQCDVSGMTDEQRVEFWNEQSELLGHLIEVRGDKITQNKDGSYSLRFPRFRSFRGMEIDEKM